MKTRRRWITDDELELLIAYHVARAKDYVQVAALARYHIDRARDLIKDRVIDLSAPALTG